LEHEKKKELFKQQQHEVQRVNDEKLKEKKDSALRVKQMDKQLIGEYTQMLEKQEHMNQSSYIMKNGKTIRKENRQLEADKEKQLKLERNYLIELELIEKRYVYIT
jgi:hypothetical protein